MDDAKRWRANEAMAVTRSRRPNGANEEVSSEGDSPDGIPLNSDTTGHLETASIFPLDSYRRAYLELHQPSWVIQFPCVTECIEATEEILSDISRSAFSPFVAFVLLVFASVVEQEVATPIIYCYTRYCTLSQI
jgi:hypothetical protein